MSRRPRRDNEDVPSRQHGHNQLRSTRTIGLQSRRNKDNDWWRPGPPTNSSSSPATNHDFEDIQLTQDPAGLRTGLGELESTRDHSPNRRGRQQVTEIIRETVEKLAVTKSDFVAPRTDSVAPSQVTELFGQLPDPIRLHEQTGEFDGEVTFIAHPNRDISAHQWSAPEFQWQVIGRYVHARGTVQGMLASDRPKDYEGSFDSLVFFKHAAKCREEAVANHKLLATSETGKDDRNSPKALFPVATQGTPIERPSSIDANTGSAIVEHKDDPRFPRSLSDMTSLGYHDDPFTSAEEPLAVGLSAFDRASADRFHNTGSLDLQYTFPTKTTITPNLKLHGNSNTSPPKLGRRSEQPQAPEAFQAYEHVPPQSILFGDNIDTMVRDQSIFKNNAMRLGDFITPHAMAEDIGDFQRLVSDVNAQSKSINTQQHPTNFPKLPDAQPTARSLFPQPGRTIANPFQLDTTGSQTAAATDKEVKSSIGVIGSSRTATNTTTVNPAAALRFSDPDGNRKMPAYEIVNGLSQQPPTKQIFKGPFFTDSKPSANDPTAILSLQVSEEEKLRAWYYDGQRPARQKDYARSLIAAAVSANKDHNFGVIGEAHRPADSSLFRNTAPFVRIYENLSEYVEEYRNNGASSYFTRAWKPTQPQSRDLVAQDNSTYLPRSIAATTPLEHRFGDRTFRNTFSPELRGSPVPTLHTMPRQTHGAVGDRRGARVGLNYDKGAQFGPDARWR